MNENDTEKLRQGGIREVVNMAWPIMLGAISFTIMDFVDKVFVARLGVDNLAAVGSSSIWAFTLGVFFLGIAGCVSTFAAQSLGRGDRENCSAYTWQGIYISLLAGAFSLLMWPLAPALFASMGHSDNVTRLEVTYFQIRILGFVFVSWQATLASFFQAVSRPRIPMYIAFVANVSNIGLDYALIFGKFGLPAMGIAGAATATVLSMLLQVILLQYVFMGNEMHKEFSSRSTFAFDWVKFRDLYRVGWPSGMGSLCDVANWSVFTSYIVGAFGTIQLAAHTAAINFIHLTFIPVFGLNYAATAIVGQWIGRGNIEIAKSRAYTATMIGIVQMIIVGTTLAVFGKDLMRIFSEDPEVIALGHSLLILAAIFAGFDAVTIVLWGALRGAGDTRWMMVVLFVGSYLVSLPLAWLFASPLGMEAKGAWIGATIYIILLAGVIFWRFHSERWRDIVIFTPDTARGDVAAEPAPVDTGEAAPQS